MSRCELLHRPPLRARPCERPLPNNLTVTHSLEPTVSDDRMPIDTAPTDGTKITVVVSYFDERTHEKTWEARYDDVEMSNGVWLQRHDDHDFPVEIPEGNWIARVTHWVGKSDFSEFRKSTP